MRVEDIDTDRDYTGNVLSHQPLFHITQENCLEEQRIRKGYKRETVREEAGKQLCYCRR